MMEVVVATKARSPAKL